jgi:hypothetical protein
LGSALSSELVRLWHNRIAVVSDLHAVSSRLCVVPSFVQLFASQQLAGH